MRSRYAFLALSGMLAVALVGCAPPAEPDWAAAEAAAYEFAGLASGQVGFLGSGSFRMDGEGSDASDESDVLLSYTDDVRVDGMTAACFGDGTARIGLTVRTGSSWIGAESVELECDGAEHVTELDEPFEGVNAVSINGVRTDGTRGLLVAVVSGLGAPGELSP